VEAAYKKSQQEDTPVALQIVKDCLKIAESASNPGRERSAAKQYEKKANQYIKQVEQQSDNAEGNNSDGSDANAVRLEAEVFSADPAEGELDCPVTISFTGRISVLQGTATVAYRWLRSDGASAPVQSVSFSKPGSETVTTSWQLGSPGDALSGWQAIEVVSPQQAKSNQAAFKVTCAPS
jgi:hypothetical protein